jgi:iron complex transport system ATP-binding protein
MALAQDTPVLLLDEPTTFPNLAAQIELLDLIRALNRDRGRSIVMVLHDLILAARYSDHIVAAGSPAEVITAALVQKVFGIEATIVTDPLTGAPLVLPDRALGGIHSEATQDRAPSEFATTA